ncbi:MAG: efflux RND transporter periplasmic adaptor subunit [Bacteroidales bacterium]|nr:efflux RND transporter periplasmic adaptor subunit [Bacteroidales bacterium]MBN2817849.1 efflux RND transporter periplasmic adaptor subunit [Bacteroidales bacterium]
MCRKGYIIISIFLIVTGCVGSSTKTINSVKKGEFRVTIVETGELKALESKSIAAPSLGSKYSWEYKIRFLEEHGASINKGDTVVIIDPSNVKKILEQEKTRLENENANLSKTYASHDRQIAQLNAQLQSEKANYELIKIQVDKFSFETESNRKIKELELKAAKEKLDAIDVRYTLMQEILKDEIIIQNIKINQIKNNIEEAKNAINKLYLVSPVNGIFQLERSRRGRNTVQVGDEVYQTQPIASIPDMSKMKVQTSINESDISKLKKGMNVIVRLDAYPDKPFHGEVSYISAITHRKSNDDPTKLFDIEVLIKESDLALKPGMTVSCEIITEELKDVTYIENECIFYENGQYYLIENLSRPEDKTLIEILSRNNQYSAIKGNLPIGKVFISQEEFNKYE